MKNPSSAFAKWLHIYISPQMTENALKVFSVKHLQGTFQENKQRPQQYTSFVETARCSKKYLVYFILSASHCWFQMRRSSKGDASIHPA